MDVLGSIDLRQVRCILLDFDGVILDSARLKAELFLDVYDGALTPQQAAEILRYQALHGGVGRVQKFRHFDEHVFRREPDEARVKMLAAKYSEQLLARVYTCPLLPGAKTFLANRHGHQSLHLISGTSQSDLDTIVARLGLTHYFDSIVGAPTEKQDAFLSILVGDQMLPHQALAIGDSMTELRAAQALRIPFIGIANPDAPDTFAAETVVLPNLAAADAIWNSAGN